MKGIFEKKESFDLIAFISKGFHAYPPLFHPHCEFVYVVSGELFVTIDGNEKRIGAGQGALVFPYVTHSYMKAADTDFAVMLFDPKITYYERLFLTSKPKCPFISDISRLFPMIERVCCLVKNENKEVSKGARGYLNGIIAEILSLITLEKSDAVETDISKKILEYCSEHFTENISIKSVSKALFISQSYVSKIFSNKLCYGFREYINLLRINRAKKLLESTDEKVLDIMLDVGFDNQSSFNRVFMDIVGESPSTYRKNKS